MNPAERAQLIRERFNKKRGNLATATKPRGMAKPGLSSPRPTSAQLISQKTAVIFPVGLSPFGEFTKRHQVEWVRVPDSRPRVTPRTKRREGVPALTRIADQLPKKLPLVNWEYRK